MQVVAVLAVPVQQLRQAPHTGHAHNVDVVVATESLKQREVDLQRDVVLVLLVRGEDAQDDAVRVSAGLEQTRVKSHHRTVAVGDTACTYTFMSLAAS